MVKKILFLLLFIVPFGASLKPVFFQNSQLLSPWITKGVSTTNLWFPQLGVLADTGAPKISAEAAYFVDIDSGKVLYQKNPTKQLPIASLTKIMTVLVTLENRKFEDKVLISNRAANMEPDHMLLKTGETLTVEELLYGVFLVSANDGAEALAENIFGNREEFINQMNSKAAGLGMKNSLFINPTGLEEDDKKQYSSAYDVALMSRFLIKHYPQVVDISSTYHKIIPQTSTHQDYDMYSGINLLTTYPGVLGLKTGFTPEAGLTLVTFASRGNHQVLGVLLKSENRREEARELLDYSFKQLGVE